MASPTARRSWHALAAVPVTLVGLLCLTFFLGRVAPADPVTFILGERADKAAYDATYHQLGLDLPIWQQFLRYGESVLGGDLGRSVITGHRVWDDVARVFPATLELATLAMLIGMAIGIPLGALAASRHNSLTDTIARVFGLLGYSTPSFWLGLMGLLLFYRALGWVPGTGRASVLAVATYHPVTGSMLLDALLAGNMKLFADAWSRIVLPAGILGYAAAAYISRMTRSFMIEQLGQDYITTARAKGVSAAAVIWGHAFRNIRVQLLTVLVLSFGLLLEGSTVVETVFSWPGLGRYLSSSLLAGDMNPVLGCVLLIGSAFVLLNFMADSLYRHLDPRTQ